MTALVQQASVTWAGNTQSTGKVITLPGAATIGNLVVVEFSFNGDAMTGVTGLGATWTEILSREPSSSNFPTASLWWAYAVSAGTTITATLNPSFAVSSGKGIAREYSGVTGAPARSTTVSAQNSTATRACPALTASINDLYVACATQDTSATATSTTQSPGSFGAVENSANSYGGGGSDSAMLSGYRIAAGAETIQLTGNYASAHNGIAVAAVFAAPVLTQGATDTSGLTDALTDVGSFVRASTDSLTARASGSNATPSGLIEVTPGSADTTERIVGDMDVTVSGSAMTIAVDLWVSMNQFGTHKFAVARVRRDNATGAVLATSSFAEFGSDDTGGHSLEWATSFTDATPTTGRYVVTLQATPNASRVYSNLHSLTVTGGSDSMTSAQDRHLQTDDLKGLGDTSGVSKAIIHPVPDDLLARTDMVVPRIPRYYVHGTAARADRSATGHMLADTPILSADWTFTVVASGTHTPPPAPPATPSAPVTAGRWQLEDPVTSAIYQFTVNPKAQGGMIPVPTVSEKTTTTGQPISNEGAARASEMVATGFLLTEAQYDAFLTWVNKPYRVFLTDDLGRQYIAFVKAFQPVLAKPYPVDPWFCQYTLRVLIFGEA